MSQAVAWSILASEQPDLGPEAAYRWRQRRNRLVHDHEPEHLLASWVASRASRQVFQSRDAEALLDDPRFVRSGLSDERAGIASGGLVEGYVSLDDLHRVRRQYLLRPGGSGSNVVLHVAPELPPSPVPMLVLAADLAEHDKPRELARARDMIHEAGAA